MDKTDLQRGTTDHPDHVDPRAEPQPPWPVLRRWADDLTRIPYHEKWEMLQSMRDFSWTVAGRKMEKDFLRYCEDNERNLLASKIAAEGMKGYGERSDAKKR